MQRAPRTARINFRAPDEVRLAAEQAAASDQRTLTNLVEKLLTDHLRQQGLLAAPPASGKRGQEPNG
jgi:hypothetical protein